MNMYRTRIVIQLFLVCVFVSGGLGEWLLTGDIPIATESWQQIQVLLMLWSAHRDMTLSVDILITPRHHLFLSASEENVAAVNLRYCFAGHSLSFVAPIVTSSAR